MKCEERIACGRDLSGITYGSGENTVSRATLGTKGDIFVPPARILHGTSSHKKCPWWHAETENPPAEFQNNGLIEGPANYLGSLLYNDRSIDEGRRRLVRKQERGIVWVRRAAKGFQAYFRNRQHYDDAKSRFDEDQRLGQQPTWASCSDTKQQQSAGSREIQTAAGVLP